MLKYKNLYQYHSVELFTITPTHGILRQFKEYRAFACDVMAAMLVSKVNTPFRGKIWPMRALGIVTSGRFCAS